MADYKIDEVVKLDGDQGQEVRLKLDEAVAKKVIDFRDSLLSTRRISTDDSITVVHQSVLILADQGLDPDEAISLINDMRAKYRAAALDDAYKVALMDDIFEIDAAQFPVRVKCSVDPTPLTPEDFDDSAANLINQQSMLPDLPKRLPGSMVEQKVAYVRRLMSRNPFFSSRVSGLFEDSIKNIVRAQQKGGATAVDQAGFLAERLVGSVDDAPVVGGKTRKTGPKSG